LYSSYAKARTAHPVVRCPARRRDGDDAPVARGHERVRVNARAERGRTAEADGRVDQSAGERSDDDCGDSDASPDISHDADHCPRDDDDADRTHPHGVVVSLSLLLAGQTVWIVARSTGVAALIALSLSLLTGMAMRPKSLTWLSTNRAVSELHSYATVLWLPLAIAHVLAILIDPYAGVRLLDLVVPFQVSYGAFAVGLGTISVQLLAVVTIAALMRSRLGRDRWLALHRLSYVAFAAAFLHGVLSGTDLAYPWLMGVAWLAAAILAMACVRRMQHALAPRKLRPLLSVPARRA